MTQFRTILLSLAAAAAITLAAVAPGQAQGRETACYTDRQIQDAIESGEIQSWPRIKKLAGIGAYDEVSDVRVCLLGGVPYYILNVISTAGEAMKIALNAVDGTQQVL
jgi:hypothetical protein